MATTIFADETIDLRSQRKALRLSQIRLGKLAGVSRWRICLYELGDGSLTADEQHRVDEALRGEASRIWELIHQAPSRSAADELASQGGNK